MIASAINRPALTNFLESITDAPLSGGEKYFPGPRSGTEHCKELSLLPGAGSF